MNRVVDKNPGITKREDKDLKRFADFLFSQGTEKITILDKPDETKRGRFRKGKCDYLIQINKDRKVGLEFTQIFEKVEQRQRSIQWGNLVATFRDELKKFRLKHKGFKWSGIYNIETPEGFGATRRKAKTIARKNIGRLINSVEKKESSVEINSFVLKLKKVIEQPKGDLYFSTGSKAGLIDTAGDIKPKLEEKLPEKNEQLAIKGADGILVIVNRHIFGETNDIISALSRVDDIWKYKNFDKIYFEESPGTFILVFSSELRHAWNRTKFLVNSSFIKTFQLWIHFLRNKDPKKTFLVVRRILTEKPYELLPDPFARQEIILLGDWLIEQKKFKDVIWLIEKFINDPDPGKPEHYKGDPQFNYDAQISKGEDPRIITTVLGHLSWLIRQLTISKRNINKTLSYTKKLLSHKNLYVKHQAIIPLIEIAAKRKWLLGFGKRPYEGAYTEFHSLCFYLLKFIKENPNYKALASRLSHVFFFYKDLSTKEAVQVLDTLKITEESSGLFIYFAIFRKRHYRDQPIKFNEVKLSKMLVDIIRAEDEDYDALRARLVCDFWEILNQNPEEFRTVSPYIDLYSGQSYNQSFYDYIELIIEEWIEREPEKCLFWFEKMLPKALAYIKKQKKRITNIFLTTEEIINCIAKYHPEKLSFFMKQLVELRLSGVYVGNLESLFQSYKLISDKEIRESTSIKFRELFQRIKKIDPKLVDIKW